MKVTALRLGTLLVLLAAACTNANPDDIVAGRCEALLQWQGLSFNGMQFNAPKLNGHTYNAPMWNGIWANAATWNGPWYNGGSFNGNGYQGSDENGIQLQGPIYQGMFLNGDALEGPGAEGVTFRDPLINGHVIEAEQRSSLFQDGLIRGQALQGLFIDGLDLAGTQLSYTAEDGSVRSGEDLLGGGLVATTELGELFPLVIAGVRADPDHSDITLYELALPNGVNVCGEGEGGIFVPGIWNFENGSRSDEVELSGLRFTASFSCLSGVIGKCVRWGYGPDVAGVDMHQTCTRLARADYCGDGVSYTENGTLIDLYDVDGIQVSESSLEEMPFEAGWSTDGAVCVNRPRYATFDADGREELPSCWESLPRCEDFTQAVEAGALFGNQSHVIVRQLSCGG